MQRILKYLSGLSVLFFCGCENLTEEEFKQKYDWAETICTAGNFTASKNTKGPRSARYYHFNYIGEKYEVYGYGFVYTEKGYQYHILFDKNAPDKNYLILPHKPVKPKAVADFTMTGKVKKVSKSDTRKSSSWKNFAYVDYKCYSVGDNDWYKYEEAIPLEYYDILKELEESQDDITVDCFVTKELSDGTGYIRTFINLEKLGK